jgi:sensor domain CHASE-containing protein
MHKSFIDRLLLPAIFGLTTLIVALVLWQRLVTHRRAEMKAAAKEQASFVKTKTESELRARVRPLERLAGRWHSDEQDMESDASLVMSGYPAYQAIEWVDPTFHVLWVAPDKGNEADIGADLGAIPELRATLEDADHSKSTMVAPRVDLRQGGRGFLVCVPAYSGKELSGFTGSQFTMGMRVSTVAGRPSRLETGYMSRKQISNFSSYRGERWPGRRRRQLLTHDHLCRRWSLAAAF